MKLLSFYLSTYYFSLFSFINVPNSNLIPSTLLSTSQVRDSFLTIYKNHSSNHIIRQTPRPTPRQNPRQNPYDSMEHIVPKSFIQDKRYVKEMHNIILLPTKLNSHRSNYKFVPEIKVNDSKTTNSHQSILDEFGEISDTMTASSSIKCSRLKMFVPQEECRGMIARAVLYFLFSYQNESSEIIFSKVIDRKTIFEWNRDFPPSSFEVYKNKCIEKLQGNENIFISYYNDTEINIEIKRLLQNNSRIILN